MFGGNGECMNQQDVEIAIEVLKERQRVQANHLKDVDECCGKLKGSTDAEFRSLSEKLIKVEDHMNDNCNGVELELTTIDERVRNQCETVKELKEELLDIRKTYKKVTLEIIVSVVVMIIALFIRI